MQSCSCDEALHGCIICEALPGRPLPRQDQGGFFGILDTISAVSTQFQFLQLGGRIIECSGTAVLPAGQLGWAEGASLTLDVDGGGSGWHTPGNHATSGYDLLTAAAHEVGHALGFGHDDHGLMAETLPEGVDRFASLASSSDVWDMLSHDVAFAELNARGRSASDLQGDSSAEQHTVAPLGVRSTPAVAATGSPSGSQQQRTAAEDDDEEQTDWNRWASQVDSLLAADVLQDLLTL